MSRRFQFSLRALLAFTAVVCLSVGGWKLLKRYGEYVEAEHGIAGQPLTIRGQFVRILSPSKSHCSLFIVPYLEHNVSSVAFSMEGADTTREKLVFQTFETKVKILRAGDYAVSCSLADEPSKFKTKCRFTVRSP